MKEELLNKIISVAYGDAGLVDKIYIKRLARKNEEVRLLLEEYQETAREIHSIKEDECPPEIIQNVEAYVNYNKRKSFVKDIYEVYLRRPVMSTAAATLLVVLVLTSIVFDFNGNRYNGYSKEQVELARNQVKKSLAIVGEVFNSTRTKIRQDVLGERVNKPIKDGIKMFDKFITEGEKNENTN